MGLLFENPTHHCQKSWLGWLRQSLHQMRPFNSNMGKVPPSESLTNSNSVGPPGLNWFLIHVVVRHLILNWMAASNINSDATIQTSIAGSACDMWMMDDEQL
jgi:hypothetical protein